MPTYSKKEYADLCKQETKYLAVMIKRGKVVLDKDGKIDTSNHLNAAYLEKIYGRMDFVPGPNVPSEILKSAAKAVKAAKRREPDDTDEDEPGESISLAEMLNGADINKLSYPDLEKIYKFRQGEHLKRRTEREEIDIKKKKGEVIPSDLLPPLILQHNQSFINAFKNVVDQILTDYAQIKNFDVYEIAEMRAKMLGAINTGASQARDMTLKSITDIVKDYTEKRSPGQRN